MLGGIFHPQSCRKKRSGSRLVSWHYWHSGPASVQPAMDNDKRSKVSCTLSDFVMVMVRSTLLMLSLRHFQIPNLRKNTAALRLPQGQYLRHPKQAFMSDCSINWNQKTSKSIYFVFIWSGIASLPHFVNRSQFYFTLRGVSLNSELLDWHERVDFFGNRLEF
jgi:hypothetical protein